MATAGKAINLLLVATMESYQSLSVSYLFRALGGVLGISIGSTLVQNSLRSFLTIRLAGQDVDLDDVHIFPLPLTTTSNSNSSCHLLIACSSCAGIACSI